jgi:hypothetical protein
VFDEYRALCFKYPRAMNFYMMYFGIVWAMFLGKGFEKIAMKSH